MASPRRMFITQHLVQHDGKDYPPGAEFPERDATAEQIAQLRARGALLSLEEAQEQAELATRQAELEAEIQRVNAEQEALRAEQAEADREAAIDAPRPTWPKLF